MYPSFYSEYGGFHKQIGISRALPQQGNEHGQEHECRGNQREASWGIHLIESILHQLDGLLSQTVKVNT